MPTGEIRFTVQGELVGQRLDRALVRLMPGNGLRAMRRLIADGNVCINGSRKLAGLKLSRGDVIEIHAPQLGERKNCGTLLKILSDFCYLHKPSGLHTVRLAGRSNASLESQLPFILPAGCQIPRLLQRLDYGTSGIICASFTGQGQQLFRQQEDAGTCSKFYLALLAGKLKEQIIAKNCLDASRARVRELASEGDKTRWSAFIPLCYSPSWQLGAKAHEVRVEDATLAICKIWRGQRHQIRVHAAGHGFPLVGDPIYGVKNGSGFFLEHFYLNFAGHKIFDLGKESLYSSLPPYAQSCVLQWLKKEAGFEPAWVPGYSGKTFKDDL